MRASGATTARTVFPVTNATSSRTLRLEGSQAATVMCRSASRSGTTSQRSATSAGTARTASGSGSRAAPATHGQRWSLPSARASASSSTAFSSSRLVPTRPPKMTWLRRASLSASGVQAPSWTRSSPSFPTAAL